MKRRLNYYGLVGGWIIGMIFQIIFFPMLFKKHPFINETWWITQLIGLTIVTVIWIILDRKVIIPWYKNSFVPWVEINWNKFLNWLNN